MNHKYPKLKTSMPAFLLFLTVLVLPGVVRADIVRFKNGRKLTNVKARLDLKTVKIININGRQSVFDLDEVESIVLKPLYRPTTSRKRKKYQQAPSPLVYPVAPPLPGRKSLREKLPKVYSNDWPYIWRALIPGWSGLYRAGAAWKGVLFSTLETFALLYVSPWLFNPVAASEYYNSQSYLYALLERGSNLKKLRTLLFIRSVYDAGSLVHHAGLTDVYMSQKQQAQESSNIRTIKKHQYLQNRRNGLILLAGLISLDLVMSVYEGRTARRKPQLYKPAPRVKFAIQILPGAQKDRAPGARMNILFRF